jgi:FKBP-type peptidyl-prolyl cis-trans isomerase
MRSWISLLALSALVALSACKAKEEAAIAEPGTPVSEVEDGVITRPSGLRYEDLKVGEGPLAELGMRVRVHYTGWLTDGTKFESSLDNGRPMTFVVGEGQVIRGWDEGAEGMRVGGRRKLIVPPNLGYGEVGAPSGGIPPNATLIFEIELVSID